MGLPLDRGSKGHSGASGNGTTSLSDQRASDDNRDRQDIGVFVASPIGARQFHVAPAGRFLMIKVGGQVNEEPSSQISVVLNWTEELKRLVPTS